MVTNTITGFEGPRKIYWPLKYPMEEKMISAIQKQKLTALIYQNLEGNERELKLMELEDFTENEGIDLLYKFSFGKW